MVNKLIKIQQSCSSCMHCSLLSSCHNTGIIQLSVIWELLYSIVLVVLLILED